MKLRKYMMFLIVVLLAINITTASAADGDELTKLKNIYAKQVLKLKKIRNQKLDELAPNYLLDLKALEKQYQNSGELEPLLAVRNEYNRFKSDRDISDITPAISPAGLTTLQKQLIKSEKKIKLQYANSIIKLGASYERRLEALKKSLTKDGKIEEALKTMEEIETIDTLPEIINANAQIDAGGTLPVKRDEPQPGESNITTATPSRKPAKSYSSATKPAKKLTKDAIEDYFHTNIREWNSITHEITCVYDFSNDDQMQAWKGGKFDKLRNRIICENTTARLIPTFASIKKVECDAYYYEGSGPVRIMLGKSLYADLTPTRDGRAVLHQGNPSFPLQKSFGGAVKYVPYHNIITISGWNVQWSVGERDLPSAKILKPISQPVKIGIGAKNSKTMYTNIKITGKLSSQTIKAILQ